MVVWDYLFFFITFFNATQNFKIIEIGNAPIQTYQKTIIYDVSLDMNDATIKELRKIFDAVTFNSGSPVGITNEQGEEIPYLTDGETDILIILGQDSKDKF